MKLIIIGGSSAGANAAARARLLDKDCEIDLIEETDTITFANCGLPYFISSQVKSSNQLISYTPEEFQKRYNVTVHINTQVISIFPAEKQIEVKNSHSTFRISYDKLILCNGCKPIQPAYDYLPQDKTFTLKTIHDMIRLKTFIREKSPRSVLVVGGGFIGMEMVDAFYKLGLDIYIAEISSQLLPKLDSEVSFLLWRHLLRLGINIYKYSVVSGYSNDTKKVFISLEEDGKSAGYVIPDCIVLTIGIQPEIEIAKLARLKIGTTGGIEVDEFLKTSDNSIYAAGDIAEITQIIAGKKIRFPLASIATKQGRIAASNALGENRKYEGVTGSYVIEICDETIGSAGISEKYAKECGIDFDFVLISPYSQDSYYPQVEKLFLKLLFEKGTGRILGVQCFGKTGVDKIIDIISTAIKGNLKINELSELDLAYAPMHSMPFHAINLSGRVAELQIENPNSFISPYWFWSELMQPDRIDNQDFLVIDLTPDIEATQTRDLPNTIHIPFFEVRTRLKEIPKTKSIYLLSEDGKDGYLAWKFLKQSEFVQVFVLKGGLDWLNCFSIATK